MIVSFDVPTKNGTGALNNTGSSAAFVGYLDKEDKELVAAGQEPEQWFDQYGKEHHRTEVRADIDQDHRTLHKGDGKFSTGSINPSAKEWEALGSNDKERLDNFKDWVAKDFTQEFAANFDKKDKAGNQIPITPDSVKIRYKIEFDRHYKGTDEAVKSGERKQGEEKDGVNVHCHFIVARNAVDKINGMNANPIRISPITKHIKEFNGKALIQNTEQSFDRATGYARPLEETYRYRNVMNHGTGKEKLDMDDEARAQKVEQSREKPIVYAPSKEFTQRQEQRRERSQERPQEPKEEQQKEQKKEQKKDRGMSI